MTPIIFYALFVKLFRAGASFQKRLIDILSTNIGIILVSSVLVLGTAGVSCSMINAFSQIYLQWKSMELINRSIL